LSNKLYQIIVQISLSKRKIECEKSNFKKYNKIWASAHGSIDKAKY